MTPTITIIPAQPGYFLLHPSMYEGSDRPFELTDLTPAGFDKLTDILKETCVFFPTIRECLDAVTCKDRYDWGHPFRGNPPELVYRAPAPTRLPPPTRQIGYDGE